MWTQDCDCVRQEWCDTLTYVFFYDGLVRVENKLHFNEGTYAGRKNSDAAPMYMA